MSIFLDQADFMKLGGQRTDEKAEVGQIDLYAHLIEEESKEFIESFHTVEGTYVEDIKEAVDVIVVAAGFLISVLGVEGAQKAWNVVHESNLSKVAGGVEKREDGKILKNDYYKKLAKVRLMVELQKLTEYTST